MKTKNNIVKGDVVSITFDSCDLSETQDFSNESKGMKRRKIKGYANKATIDRGGDLVLPTAFEKSMEQFMKNPLVFYNHDWNTPIGTITDWKIKDGLFVEVDLATGDEDADRAWNRAKKGLLRSFSIGFMSKEADWDDERNIRIIKDLELLEVSLVTIPMNAESTFEIDEKGVVKSVMFLQKEGQALTYKQLHPEEDSVQTKDASNSSNSNSIEILKDFVPKEDIEKVLPEKFDIQLANCTVCGKDSMSIGVGTNVYSKPLYACKGCFTNMIPEWTSTSETTDKFKIEYNNTKQVENGEEEGEGSDTEEPGEAPESVSEDLNEVILELQGIIEELQEIAVMSQTKIKTLESQIQEYDTVITKIEDCLLDQLSDEVKKLIRNLVDIVKI